MSNAPVVLYNKSLTTPLHNFSPINIVQFKMQLVLGLVGKLMSQLLSVATPFEWTDQFEMDVLTVHNFKTS
jgi:hypothetical protein